METLSLSPGVLEGLNIVFHSDSSGNGGRADKGVSFEFEVEVEYGEGPEVAWRIRAARVDETCVGLKHERGTRFSDDLETRAVENIVSLDLHALEVVTG